MPWMLVPVQVVPYPCHQQRQRHLQTTKPFERSPRLPLSESLGTEGIIVLFGGSFGILGTLGFLVFLWFGCKSPAHADLQSSMAICLEDPSANYEQDGPDPEASKATWVWRQLALHDWMSQAVTVASIVFQLIIAAQATVCTSMIAALLLERLSVQKSPFALVSVHAWHQRRTLEARECLAVRQR